MRITRCVCLVLIVLSIHVAGCGDDDANKPVDMRPADTSQFDGMKDAMTKNLKAGGTKSATPKP